MVNQNNMIKPFKFFKGNPFSDENTLITLTNMGVEPPPFGISHRHWNMMPQDLRDATLQEMSCYIQGWEHARIGIMENPYHDRIRRSLWNRGFLRWRGRTGMNYRNVNPDPPIDETYPEFYNTDEFIFFDVTQVMTDPDSVRPYKFMLFRHIEDGYTIQGERIYSNHPMWNFPDII